MYTKKVTIGHIAKKAGVSSATVSLILSGRQDVRIADDTRESVLALARKLGYVGRTIKRGRTVFFVHGSIHGSNIGTSFFSAVAANMRPLCQERGFTFIELSFTNENFHGQLSVMTASDTAAVVSMNGAFSAFLREHEPAIPLFSLQGDVDPAGAINYIVDDRMVGETAARHLLEKGCRNAAVIFPSGGGRCASERNAGFSGVFSAGGGTSKFSAVGEFFSLEAVESFMRDIALAYTKMPRTTTVRGI